MSFIRFSAKALLVVLIVSLAGASVAHGRDRKARGDEASLVVVHSCSTPPFSFMGMDATPKGVVCDFWRAWAARVGVDVAFVQADWPTSLEMMRDGRADIHGGLFYLEERDRYLDYAQPLFPQKATLFVRASQSVRTVSELEARYVGVLDEGYSEYWLSRRYPQLRLRAYPTSLAMVQAALAGEVDALLTEQTTLVTQLGAVGKLDEFVPLVDMYERSIRGAVAEGRTDLLALLERGIRDMGAEERRKIFERWIIVEEAFPDWLLPAAVAGGVSLVIGLAAVGLGWRRPG